MTDQLPTAWPLLEDGLIPCMEWTPGGGCRVSTINLQQIVDAEVEARTPPDVVPLDDIDWTGGA